MELFTAQLAQWRTVQQLNIPYLDTTIKSGLRYFSPTWEMVSGYKKKIITEEEYSAQYLELMAGSQVKVPKAWEKLFTYDQLCIMCYCRSGHFCHRHLLKDLIKDYAIEHNLSFSYGGEIVKDGILKNDE